MKPIIAGPSQIIVTPRQIKYYILVIITISSQIFPNQTTKISYKSKTFS